MFVDSHCHLDMPELMENLDDVMENMTKNKVLQALVVSCNIKDWDRIDHLVSTYDHLWASVGTHPDYEDVHEPTVEELLDMLKHPKVIATGETGLDYFRLTGDLEWQRQRFRRHIQAAKASGKPLIIHTRNAQEDTIDIMRQESANEIGGVMHCFTEDVSMAKQALDLGFYISFSGIVSFKNAHVVHETAKYVPLDRLLIETDSPYLAPVPYRGKVNQPAWVSHVASSISVLKNVPIEQLAQQTTQNFMSCFKMNAQM